MFKFAPSRLPVTILMVEWKWATTVVGIELVTTEEALGEMMDVYHK